MPFFKCIFKDLLTNLNVRFWFFSKRDSWKPPTYQTKLTSFEKNCHIVRRSLTIGQKKTILYSDESLYYYWSEKDNLVFWWKFVLLLVRKRQSCILMKVCITIGQKKTISYSDESLYYYWSEKRQSYILYVDKGVRW